VYHQGELLGQTPLFDVELPPGVVRLRAVNREQEIDEILFVRIKPGALTVKRHNFP
jgi:hypothetical protein